MQISENGKLVKPRKERKSSTWANVEGTYLIIQQLFNPVSFTVLSTDVRC